MCSTVFQRRAEPMLTAYVLCLVCGDVSDVANNGGTPAPETDCNMACSGDPIHLCGGGSRLQLYIWNGDLTNWQTPSNIGFYEVRTFANVEHLRC